MAFPTAEILVKAITMTEVIAGIAIADITIRAVGIAALAVIEITTIVETEAEDITTMKRTTTRLVSIPLCYLGIAHS